MILFCYRQLWNGIDLFKYNYFFLLMTLFYIFDLRFYLFIRCNSSVALDVTISLRNKLQWAE